MQVAISVLIYFLEKNIYYEIKKPIRKKVKTFTINFKCANDKKPFLRVKK